MSDQNEHYFITPREAKRLKVIANAYIDENAELRNKIAEAIWILQNDQLACARVNAEAVLMEAKKTFEIEDHVPVAVTW